MKPLDFVKTPEGRIAIVTETVTDDNGHRASIEFIGRDGDDHEKNSWWEDGELVVIDNLPYLLAREVAHPFGSGRKDAIKTFN